MVHKEKAWRAGSKIGRPGGGDHLVLIGALAPVLTSRRVGLVDDTIVVHAEGSAEAVACPTCGQVSRRVHGRYQRRLVDLPWHGRPVRLVVTVRSFRCDNPRCRRATFVEDFGDALPRRARRTREATRYLAHLAAEVGGEAGARRAAIEGLPASPDTLLRLPRRDQDPDAAAGGDDYGDSGGSAARV
jgi:hypothetical protein